MSPKIYLICLLGLPATGKSSFAVKLQAFSNNFENCHPIHINYDEIMKNNISDWKALRKDIFKNVEKLLFYIKNKENVTFQCNTFQMYVNLFKFSDITFVIIDDNMYYRSMRYEYYQLARSFSINYCQIFFPQNELEKLYQINRKRSEDSFIPEEVIFRMAQRFEIPNSKWEKEITWTIKNQYVEMELIYKWIIECPEVSLNCADMKSPNSSIETTQSVIHRVDIILRKILHEKIKDFRIKHNNENSQDFIQGINQRRIEIIEGVKQRQIEIPSGEENELRTFLMNLFS